MNINITETDLISYFYNESSPEVTDYIHVNLSNRLDWQEFIQDLISGQEPFTVSVTLASGITYSGSGKIEGESNFNSNDGQLEFAFRSENFEQI